MSEENLKVAVRCRPFNKREIARNATVIVSMNGGTTELTNPDQPKEKPKKFTFDHSYWSHDGCKDDGTGYMAPDTKHANGKKFAGQKQVYEDLGRGVLRNAWEGFNSTLFAYGQTGSGKSWSVVGYGVNKGIVPQFCGELYQEIDKKKAEGSVSEFEVQYSMLEIYMEEVRDLLDSRPKKKGGLRVRQHPKKGFYVENLQVSPVGSYKDIERKMEEGTMNRTVASTNMNATSSRAHTIVGISFIQKFKNAAGEDTTKSAQINLVDLAGSERADSTGATGDRLKEGAAINQSLSSLGNVIAALADRSNGKDVKVPFRDSTLTKLLKNALGGNSKTIMVAAVSPADINYDETLSTLRYADRAKQIKTKAVVNEDPTDKLIRELREENDKLKEMLESGGVVLPQGDGENGIEQDENMSAAEKEELKQQLQEEYKAQLEANAREMEEMKKAFQEKLQEAQENDSATQQQQTEVHAKRKTDPHIYNLNFDSQLSGKILHFLSNDKMTLGSNKGEQSDIVMGGPSIQKEHAVFTKEGNNIFIDKIESARMLINGEPLTEKTQLHHNDRLMFGTTQLYVLNFPKEKESSKQNYPDVTYEMAQEEIASNSGFDMTSENKSKDDMLLQEDLADILPDIQEANSISEDLDKKMKFEVVLVSAAARGQTSGRTKLFVKMIDLETGYDWIWSREKFINRKYVMQELFQKYEEGENINVPPEKDPFLEDYSSEQIIGGTLIYLQSLAYNIETKETLALTDYKGVEVGHIEVEMVPCNKKGKEYLNLDDVFVDDPTELVGKETFFLVKIKNSRGLPSSFTEIYARYKWYVDEQYKQTKAISDTFNPDWNHQDHLKCEPVTDQMVKYLREGCVFVEVLGKRKKPKEKKTINTKDVMQKQSKSMGKGQMLGAMNTKMPFDANKVRMAMELAVAKRRAEKAEQKVQHFKELVRLAEQYEKPRISTKLIKDILHAPTNEIAEKCFKMIPKEKGAGN